MEGSAPYHERSATYEFVWSFDLYNFNQFLTRKILCIIIIILLIKSDIKLYIHLSENILKYFNKFLYTIRSKSAYL